MAGRGSRPPKRHHVEPTTLGLQWRMILPAQLQRRPRSWKNFWMPIRIGEIERPGGKQLAILRPWDDSSLVLLIPDEFAAFATANVLEAWKPSNGK